MTRPTFRRRGTALTLSAMAGAAVVFGAALLGRPTDSPEAATSGPRWIPPRTPAAAFSAQGVAVEKLMVAPPVPTAAPTAALGASPQDRSTTALRRHELIRTGSLSLLVPDVERALVEARGVADSVAGDITGLSDQRPASPEQGRVATVTVAVPEGSFDAALDRLAAVGGIRSRSVTARDAGDRIVDVRARLRNLRRTEADMLRVMDRSGKIGEVLDVENQLAAVRESIEQLSAESADLQHRVAYATIDVTLATAAATPAAEPSAATQVNTAWHAALDRVRGTTLALAADVFVIVAFIPDWLLVVLVMSMAFRLVRRRLARA